jgi:peptidoglycan/xylan/chitin deacetylase (PgdA/CDA1 family)
MEFTNWRGEKRAACSVMFDDTVPSHHVIAAPELESRGMRGSFAIVTSRIGDWRPWQGLFDRGHEIVNHTASHPHFSALDPERVDAEIRTGRDEILHHMPEVDTVPSFVYPYEDAPKWSEEIVARYHLFARATRGTAIADPPNMMLIPGFGNYYPFSLSDMKADLDLSIAAGGWYIPYFHVISGDERPSSQQCPLNTFRAILDYIQQRAGDLWVAPFGEVGEWVRDPEVFTDAHEAP